MYRGKSCGVVIPAYNEEGFVGDSIESVPQFVDRVYVVDDGSTDGTWDEIRTTADRLNSPPNDEGTAAIPRIQPVQHDENKGVGGAIKTGYRMARDDEIFVTAVMGGDGQMEPEVLGDLFDPIVEGRADYTKGNRFLGNDDHGEMPKFRFVGNIVLNILTKIASGYWRSGDPQSGYTAISLRALHAANIDAMYEYYGYCNDLLVRLNVAGMRVEDIPRPITYGDEESHIRYRSYVPRVSAMLLRNFLWRLKTKYVIYDFHPLVLAYVVAFVTCVAGAGAAIWALPGVGDSWTPVARGLLALTVFSIGMVSFVLATSLDKRANEHLEPAASRGSTDSQAETAKQLELADHLTPDRPPAMNGGDQARTQAEPDLEMR